MFWPQSGEQIARKQTGGGILVKVVAMEKENAEDSWSQNIPRGLGVGGKVQDGREERPGLGSFL